MYATHSFTLLSNLRAGATASPGFQTLEGCGEAWSGARNHLGSEVDFHPPDISDHSSGHSSDLPRMSQTALTITEFVFLFVAICHLKK